MVVTVITMYRGHDAEMFTHVVEGVLTEQQRQEWRDTHKCDLEDHDDDANNLFFREVTVSPNDGTYGMKSVDAEGEPALSREEVIASVGFRPYKS